MTNQELIAEAREKCDAWYNECVAASSGYHLIQADELEIIAEARKLADALEHAEAFINEYVDADLRAKLEQLEQAEKKLGEIRAELPDHPDAVISVLDILAILDREPAEKT